MGMILTLLCVCLIFIVWDMRLRISYCLYGRKRYERFSKVQKEGARYVLAVATAYTGFRLVVENSLTAGDE